MRELLKKTVRKAVNACGFEMTRIWAAHRTTMGQVLGNVVETGFRPAGVIDVGVGDGTDALYAAFPETRFLLVEPLAERERVMQRICREVNGEYVVACAGAEVGTITLNVHRHLNGSSTMNETEGAHADGVAREVPVVTLDGLVSERELAGPLVLKIDTQGAELTVLAGAAETLAACELVILEVQFFEFLEGAPQFYDIVTYMKQQGFVAYDCFGNYYRALDGALAAMDMVFVKEDGLFRESHAFATERQRQAMQKIFVPKRPVAEPVLAGTTNGHE